MIKLKFLQLTMLNSEKFYFGGCSCQKTFNFSVSLIVTEIISCIVIFIFL